MRSITVLADVDRTANSFSIVQRGKFCSRTSGKISGSFSSAGKVNNNKPSDHLRACLLDLGLRPLSCTSCSPSNFDPTGTVIVLVIIPFGIIGAVVGHVLNLEFTIFNMFGLIAAPGVVVNDSIVLDFINRMINEGHSIRSPSYWPVNDDSALWS